LIYGFVCIIPDTEVIFTVTDASPSDAARAFGNNALDSLLVGAAGIEPNSFSFT
jgi:hypothetical protein